MKILPQAKVAISVVEELSYIIQIVLINALKGSELIELLGLV
jgi:hypothetical protein